MRGRKPRQVQNPGEAPQSDSTPAVDTQHDEDAAIAAAQRGQTHKVAKHTAAFPASPITGDPARPATMPVNAKGEMKYDDAMALRNAGQLSRPVLTELGWVTANEVERPPERR